MSQLTVVKSQMKDLESLRNALKGFGIPLTQGGKARFYYGQSEECDYLAKLPGKYDIGFKLDRATGAYSIVADSEVLSEQGYSLAADARKLFGPGLRNLHQEYSYHRLAKEEALAGRMVSREVLPDGRLRLRVTGY